MTSYQASRSLIVYALWLSLSTGCGQQGTVFTEDKNTCFDEAPVCEKGPGGTERLKICIGGSYVNSGASSMTPWVDCDSYCKGSTSGGSSAKADPYIEYDGTCDAVSAEELGSAVVATTTDRSWCRCEPRGTCGDPGAPECLPPRACTDKKDECVCGVADMATVACLPGPKYEASTHFGRCTEHSGYWKFEMESCEEYCGKKFPALAADFSGARCVDEIGKRDSEDAPENPCVCWAADSSCKLECRGLECGPAWNAALASDKEGKPCITTRCEEYSFVQDDGAPVSGDEEPDVASVRNARERRCAEWGAKGKCLKELGLCLPGCDELHDTWGDGCCVPPSVDLEGSTLYRCRVTGASGDENVPQVVECPEGRVCAWRLNSAANEFPVDALPQTLSAAVLGEELKLSDNWPKRFRFSTGCYDGRFVKTNLDAVYVPGDPKLLMSTLQRENPTLEDDVALDHAMAIAETVQCLPR